MSVSADRRNSWLPHRFTSRAEALRSAAGVLALSLLPPLLAAVAVQPLTAQQDTIAAGGYAVEVTARDRWLHGRQQPAFTPLREDNRWIYIDSVAALGDGGRTVLLRIPKYGAGRGLAQLQTGPTGAIRNLEVTWPGTPRSHYRSQADSIQSERFYVFDGHRLVLPEARVWDVVPSFPRGRPRPGRRWTDALNVQAERGPFQQALTGQRVSIIVRDTTVQGRRLWIVRDSARVRYEERWVNRERTLDTLATVHRVAEGVIRGSHLYDPEIGLFRARSDTTHLLGEAVLRYPDGRAFPTPARYDRIRRWMVYDTIAYRARMAELQAARSDRYRGMVIIPDSDLERRLAAGGRRLQDSLIAEWRRTADPNRREDLLHLLSRWGRLAPDARQELFRMRLEVGDTASVIRSVVSGGNLSSPRVPIGADTIRLLLPFMADPGLAFAFGLDRDPFYENLRQGLLYRPPAITEDTLQWPCAPEACRLLARQSETAREPRLRELGLIAHLVLDPARWSDTVLARAAAGSTMLGPAVLVVRGVGATWGSAAKAPAPAPGADWRAWREWMNGQDTAYISPTNAPPPQEVRWERSHATALRFYAARTGRDVVGELRRAFEAARTDSARLVFGTVLHGLGEHRPDPAAVAFRLRSSSAAERSLATSEMRALIREARPADPATQAHLLDGLLRHVISKESVWPFLHPAPNQRTFGPQMHSSAERPVFLLADSLPPAVRERWKDRVHLVSRAEWNTRSDRLPAVYYVASPVQRLGPFARLYITYGEREARASDQAPVGYAGGVTLYLLDTEGGWVIVGSEGWVT